MKDNWNNNITHMVENNKNYGKIQDFYVFVVLIDTDLSLCVFSLKGLKPKQMISQMFWSFFFQVVVRIHLYWQNPTWQQLLFDTDWHFLPNNMNNKSTCIEWKLAIHLHQPCFFFMTSHTPFPQKGGQYGVKYVSF